MNSIVDALPGWRGTPFHWEASIRQVGADCKGHLRGVARDAGRPEADSVEACFVGYSRNINEMQLLAGLDRLFKRRRTLEPKPGDVLAFRIRDKVQHLGIMGKNGRFDHAYSLPPRQVIETPLSGIWLNRLAGVWAWR